MTLRTNPQLILAVAFSFLSLLGRANAESSQELKARVDSLRVQARFSDALPAARSLLALLQSNSKAMPYEIGDAERLVATLEFISSLPDSSQRELSQADRFDAEAERAYVEGKYAIMEEKARYQLETRQRLLGSRHFDVLGGLNNLGLALQVQENYAGADALLREAVDLARSILEPEHPMTALSLNNLAFFLQARSEYAESELCFRESLAMYKKMLGDENLEVARTLSNLGVVLRDRGEYGKAEPLMREALLLHRRIYGQEHSAVATSLHNLGLLFRSRGDLAAAESLLREALAMDRRLLGDEHPTVALSLNNLAAVLQDREKYTEAESLYSASLAIRRKLYGNTHSSVATGLHNLASALEAQGDHARAESLCKESLGIRRKAYGEKDNRVAASLFVLSSSMVNQGNCAEAEKLARQALEIREAIYGTEHPIIAQTLRGLGRIDHCLGEKEKGLKSLERSATIFESARLRTGSGLEKATFQESPYSPLAETLLEIGNTEAAWPNIERDLGRVLADLLMNAGRRPLTQAEIAQEDSLQLALSDLERQLEVLRKAARTDSSSDASNAIERARNRLLETEADWSAFTEAIREKYPLTEGQAFPLNRIQHALGNDTAIVGWLDVTWREGEHVSHAYVIRNKKPVAWAKVPVGSTPPSASIASVRMQLADPNPSSDFVRDSKALFTSRIAPILPALKGVHHLIVIPSGAMRDYPVEALIDDHGHALVERFTVSYAPSATIYAWLLEKPVSTNRSHAALLVGDPPFTKSQSETRPTDTADGQDPWLASSMTFRSASSGNEEALATLPPLPATRQEVQSLASLNRSSVLLLGPEATESALVRFAQSGELSSFRILHFATHALINDERPEDSFLVLSRVDLPDPLQAAVANERIYDGLVSAKEILREWKLDADLVTLSACNTALGKVVSGEGTVGFAHSFFQVGARSLLVSLWKVDDRATSLLMQRFYQNWWQTDVNGNNKKQSKVSKAKALQEAKKWVRTQKDESGRLYGHPYFWSGFVLVGDSR